MIQYSIILNAKEHKKFCEVMDKKLTERDMTYQELAYELKVGAKSIYNFKSDTSKNPSKFLAGKIATYLDIRPKDYKSKTSFFGILIPLTICSLIIPFKVKATESNIPKELPIYKEESNIEEEVFGIDYGTDFVPGYYEAELLEDIPISPIEQREIKKICESKNISFSLVMAIIEIESSYKRDAISADGKNKGAMQLNTSFHQIENPYDLLENVDVGTDYISSLFNEHDDVGYVLSIYHGEKDAEEKYKKGVMSNYSRKIIERSKEIENELGY